jgi:hypothetical protein
LKEGLFLELEKSIESDAVYVKVLAPFWRLAEEAQTTNCKADLAVSQVALFFALYIGLRKRMRHLLSVRSDFY